jgi:hypothetical protein
MTTMPHKNHVWYNLAEWITSSAASNARTPTQSWTGFLAGCSGKSGTGFINIVAIKLARQIGDFNPNYCCLERKNNP